MYFRNTNLFKKIFGSISNYCHPFRGRYGRLTFTNGATECLLEQITKGLPSVFPREFYRNPVQLAVYASLTSLKMTFTQIGSWLERKGI